MFCCIVSIYIPAEASIIGTASCVTPYIVWRKKYMEPNKEANKPRISYRYYELPEGELVQAITGED